ncbi:carboxylate-amine ligase [Brevibacterium ihuae]|uniref:carboxylate-amine ligase n=1 Tax=Brevibacterium ihuae TaxID=1631743 RepID=UPI000C75D821|nr:YbdK family carboxylate-amine ligase [Brevibacterium ihuae]
MTTFGIEEEYLLIDRDTGLPASPSPEQTRTLHALEVAGGSATAEWFTCQLEYNSPVHTETGPALSKLLGFRRALAATADRMGFAVAALGTAPDHPRSPSEVSPGAHYSAVAELAPRFAVDHHVNGLHVHVGLADIATGVRALNGLRPWLPVLVALGANSPVWQGADTGFASWRTIHYRRWLVNGIPPRFHDLADYESRVAALVALDAVPDRNCLGWIVRLSPRYGTLEIRASDAQLRAGQTVALASLARALVVMSLAAPLPGDPPPELLDTACWQAARFGLSGTLLDPVSGTQQPAEAVVLGLLQRARPHFSDDADRECAEAGIARLLGQGSGAARQRRALGAGGLPGLLDFAAAELTAADGE